MKIPETGKAVLFGGLVMVATVGFSGCNRAQPNGTAAVNGAAPSSYPQNANSPANPPLDANQSGTYGNAPVQSAYGSSTVASNSSQRQYSDQDRHPIERLDRDSFVQNGAAPIQDAGQPLASGDPAPPPPNGTVVRDRYGREHVVREYYARPQHEVVTERSTKHSAEIVGGTAAVGAVIGALAGGGKGAAIGALAGGGGGFIYDRATHKKVRVE